MQEEIRHHITFNTSSRKSNAGSKGFISTPQSHNALSFTDSGNGSMRSSQLCLVVRKHFRSIRSFPGDTGMAEETTTEEAASPVNVLLGAASGLQTLPLKAYLGAGGATIILNLCLY